MPGVFWALGEGGLQVSDVICWLTLTEAMVNERSCGRDEMGEVKDSANIIVMSVD